MSITKYNLEERTFNFSEKLIDLCKIIPKNTLTFPIIDQLIRSGTSIGANYQEANGAISKKDFRNKIFICKREAKETHYWLRLLNNFISEENIKREYINILQEAHQLILIFSKISQNV